MLSIADDEQLEFGLDLNAARYTGGIRETPNGEVSATSLFTCQSFSIARLFYPEA